MSYYEIENGESLTGIILGVYDDAYINVGGSANNIILDGGYMDVDGVVNNVTINDGGLLCVDEDTGVANGITVNTGGCIRLWYGGTARLTTVNPGGKILIYGNDSFVTTIDGLSIAGDIEMSSGYLKNIGVINFNISACDEVINVILDDWSHVINAGGSYTITVSKNQATGVYNLIGNVTEFDQSITIKDDNGKFYQYLDLKDKNTVKIGDAEFRLKLDEEEKVLSLVVDNGISDQILERLARNSNVNGEYKEPDVIYNVPHIRQKKQGDILEFEIYGEKYYFKFDALFDDNNNSGFFAMGLLQCDKDGNEFGNAVLVCQGTQGDTFTTTRWGEGITDVFTDLNPQGIGYNQSKSIAFAQAVQWVQQQNDENKVYVTGQSLGGGVAQMVASKAGELYKLVTFNPTGINADEFKDVSADAVTLYVNSGDFVSMGGSRFIKTTKDGGKNTVNIIQTGFILGNAADKGNYQKLESNWEWLLSIHDRTFLSTASTNMDYVLNSVDRNIIYTTDNVDGFLSSDNFSYLHLPYIEGKIKQDYQGQIITGKDGSKFFFNSDYARWALRFGWGNLTIANNLLIRERSEFGRAAGGALVYLSKAANGPLINYLLNKQTQPGLDEAFTIGKLGVALGITALQNLDVTVPVLATVAAAVPDFNIYGKVYNFTDITIGDKPLDSSLLSSSKDFRTVDLDCDHIPDLIYNITDRRFEALEYVDSIWKFIPGNGVFSIKATIDKASGWVAVKLPDFSSRAYKFDSAKTDNTDLSNNIFKKDGCLYLLDDPATEYTINFTRDLNVTAEKGIISFTEDEITADTTSITVYASDIDMSKTVGGSNDTLTLTISVGDREESVVLQETAIEGIFSGTIKINQKDGISVFAGETLYASYIDPKDGYYEAVEVEQEISAVGNAVSLTISDLLSGNYSAQYDSVGWKSFHILMDNENIQTGKYLIAKNVGDFASDVVLYDNIENNIITLNADSSDAETDYFEYALIFQDNNLYLNVTGKSGVEKSDLIVSGFSMASDVKSTDALKITFTVKNQGEAIASESRLFIYDDGVQIGEVYIDSLAAGDVYKASYTIAAGTLTAGSNKIRLVADGDQTVLEKDNTNNGYTKTVNVTEELAPADLIISSFDIAASAKTNEDLKLNVTVKNQGGISAKASRVYIYNDGVKIGDIYIGTVYAGKTYTNTYTIAAGTLKAGARKIRLVADGANIVPESDNNNNGYTKTVTVTEELAPADLIISGFDIAASAKTNEDLKLTVTVKNQGGISAKASRVYIYNDGVKIGDIYIGTVYAGKTYTNTYTIAAGTLKAGARKIRLVADGANIVPESDNNNNGYTKTVTVTEELAPADLIISGFDIAASAKANEDLKLTVTVKNHGGISAKASRVYVYNDGVKIGDIYIGTVYAGKTYTNTYTIAAGTLKAGARKIRLVADGANIVPESDNNNNGYTKTVNVTEELAPADLIISGFDIAASAKTNEDLKLTVTVKNQGGISAKASRVYIYNDGVKIGDIYIGTVYAGKTYTNTYTIAAGTLKAGDHKIRLVADGANIVPESDNNNNGYTKTVTVAQAVTPADLVIGSLNAPASVTTSQNVTLTFTTRNTGGTAAASSIAYIYLDGNMIGATMVNALAAGASAQSTYTISAGMLTAGSHRLRVVADGNNAIVESDNNNNGYSRAINVTAAVKSVNAPASVMTVLNADAPLAFEEVLDDAVDTFEFELSASGKVDIDLTLDDVASAKVALFDAVGNEFALNDALTSVDTLSAGLYQVAISADEETTRKYAVELGIA